MSSIILLSEAKGARPSFGYTDELERASLRSGKETWNVRARALNEYSVRAFEIVHDELNNGQLFWLEDCWSKARGGVLAMNFTPPRDSDANAFEVFFLGDDFAYQNVSPKVWRARYRIMEAL